MKRYKFAIHTALTDTVKELNKLINDFGYDGHAIGFKMGNVEINIPEESTIEFVRHSLQKKMNEVFKQKELPEIWLVNNGEVVNA